MPPVYSIQLFLSKPLRVRSHIDAKLSPLRACMNLLLLMMGVLAALCTSIALVLLRNDIHLDYCLGAGS